MPVSVYILRCADGSYYTGLTRRPLEERVGEHNSGLIKGYTSSRLPVHLVFAESFERLDQAIPLERQIKGWSRRKKEALISGNYELLSELANSKRQ